jgi:hypothetical protein
MAQITISFSNTAGDIPVYEFTKQQLQDSTFLEEQLNLSNDKVFVCFQSWKNEPYEFQNCTFIITSSIEDAILWYEDYIENINCKNIDFNFFGFKSFEEAFKYCIDLKEGL